MKRHVEATETFKYAGLACRKGCHGEYRNHNYTGLYLFGISKGFCPHKAELSDNELFDKVCSALLKVLARKAPSSAEWMEASDESNQEQILWAWSQVVRWSKNLYSASWKPIHSGELVPDR